MSPSLWFKRLVISLPKGRSTVRIEAMKETIMVYVYGGKAVSLWRLLEEHASLSPPISNANDTSAHLLNESPPRADSWW